MQPALHLTTKVLPGKKIEIEIPEGEIGDTVDIFVVLPEKPKKQKLSVLELIETSRSQRSPRSAEDIDRQLQEERNSWDS
ncbi:MAG: hypothetical protein AB4206_20640 [Xenococcaceae cyanobacterium]